MASFIESNEIKISSLQPARRSESLHAQAAALSARNVDLAAGARPRNLKQAKAVQSNLRRIAVVQKQMISYRARLSEVEGGRYVRASALASLLAMEAAPQRVFEQKFSEFKATADEGRARVDREAQGKKTSKRQASTSKSSTDTRWNTKITNFFKRIFVTPFSSWRR